MEVGTCLISLPCRWYSAIIWPQDWFPWRPLGGTLRAPRGWNSDRPRARFGGHCKTIQSANVSNQRRSLDNIIQHQFHQGLPMVTWFIKFDSPQASTVHMQRNAGIVGISRSTPGRKTAELPGHGQNHPKRYSVCAWWNSEAHHSYHSMARGDVGPTLLHFGRSSVTHHGKKSSKLQDGARGPSKICCGGKCSLPCWWKLMGILNLILQEVMSVVCVGQSGHGTPKSSNIGHF